jgi:hypothetical protein
MQRLDDVVGGLERAKAWPDSTLVAGFVFGALVDGDRELERVQVALVVDEAAEAVPWMSRPRHLESFAITLRFTKLPLSWWWRPAEWPVWNHAIDGAVRVWTAAEGRDEHALKCLASGSLDDVTIETPASRDALMAELRVERDVALRHLAGVKDAFYDRDWRRAHREDGIYPEDHLWWAVAALFDLDDALTELGH